MTRMTGPDCVVMCNLINTHTHIIFRFLFVLIIEYIVRSFLPNGDFLPCDVGLDFLHELTYVRIQSINQSIIHHPHTHEC